ncbi:HAMP domain-containing sensor histidine kinase [Aquibacillus saliphilus]|uniref:HAMP domain-containing sensor histidine kinase n=1 Tax=Aquibacillus saliphilus TaxID=1909422 RepID=UPI001CF0507A|nr:HAMP domain-containing histidine kinase [Aquibacillus saliphilus]
MKLRTKIQVFLSLIMIIVIIFINTAIYFLFYKVSLDAEVERVQSQANTLMEALAENENIDADPHQFLRAYIPSNGMIRVINDQNEVIESISKEVEYYNLPFTFVKKQSQQVIQGDSGTRYAIISVPLIWNDGQVMTLQVAEHLTSLKETMSTLFIVLVFASLIMIVPALIAGRWLGNFVIKPIRQLTHSMTDNPKDGEWKKIDIHNRSKDELYLMGNTYNQMIDRLNESFNRQEQFVSDASHELKTPITIIKSYAQLLKRWGNEKPEIFDEAVQAINSESNRMQHMTEQMLSLAKNQQRENLLFESVNLIALTQDIIRSLSVAYNRKITLFTELQNLEHSADKEKISQALYILIDNACKYSDSEINISIDQFEQEIQISVEDFGEGLTETEQEHIFDRFYRADKARNRESGGTGLGLSIALYIVRAHGGDIKVKSNEGEWSVFTIHLPY